MRLVQTLAVRNLVSLLASSVLMVEQLIARQLEEQSFLSQTNRQEFEKRLVQLLL